MVARAYDLAIRAPDAVATSMHSSIRRTPSSATSGRRKTGKRCSVSAVIALAATLLQSFNHSSVTKSVETRTSAPDPANMSRSALAASLSGTMRCP